MMCGLDCCSDEQRRAVIRICEALINKERRKLKARGIYHSPPSLSPPAWWEILAGSWSFLKCAMFEFNDVDIRSHVPNDHQTAWTYSFLIRIYLTGMKWLNLNWPTFVGPRKTSRYTGCKNSKSDCKSDPLFVWEPDYSGLENKYIYKYIM